MRRAMMVAAGCAGLAVVAAAGQAVGAQVAVTGTQTLVRGADTPDPTDDVFTMTGGLVGQWSTTRFDLLGADPLSGRVVAVGAEHFDGCLDRNHDGSCGGGDVRGALDFGYVFWGQFDLASFAEQSGQCVHPTISGTGGFAGSTGVLTFVDDPPGSGTAIYRGRLSVPSLARSETSVRRTRVVRRASANRTRSGAVAGGRRSVRGCA